MSNLFAPNMVFIPMVDEIHDFVNPLGGRSLYEHVTVSSTNHQVLGNDVRSQCWLRIGQFFDWLPLRLEACRF
jgi:hypothetical protein